MNNFFHARSKDRSKKEEEKVAKKARWLPFQRYWLLYTVLIGTAILSAFAGLYIGLAPDKSGSVNIVDAIDGFRRVFFSLFYLISFVVTAEGATLYWETKLVYHDVDDEGKRNEIQVKTARFALIVSLLTIVGTGLASARFLSAWLGALKDYETVPVGAQAWVVWSIPIMFVFHAVCSILYWYNSAESELDRWKSQIRRQTQAQMAQVEAQSWQDEYTRVAPSLARAKGLAMAQKAAKEDFYANETAMGKDIDGDGFVGDPNYKRLPAEFLPNTETKAGEFPKRSYLPTRAYNPPSVAKINSEVWDAAETEIPQESPLAEEQPTQPTPPTQDDQSSF